MSRAVGCLCLVLAAALPCGAATLVVHPSGAGPYPTIQAAITAASPGDTVALDSGVFAGPGNIDLVYSGKQVVVRSISGDPSGCVIDVASATGHRGFWFVAADGPGAVLEGVTIRRGRQDHDYGGGILCSGGARPSIRNCIFTESSAFSGGGIGVDNGSHPTIVDCVFFANSASWDGGAIGTPMNGSCGMTVLRCRFDTNRAGDHGAAVSCYGPGRFEDCAFIGNIGNEGGAFFTCGFRNSEFRRCTFIRNTGYVAAAGMT